MTLLYCNLGESTNLQPWSRHFEYFPRSVSFFVFQFSFPLSGLKYRGEFQEKTIRDIKEKNLDQTLRNYSRRHELRIRQ